MARFASVKEFEESFRAAIENTQRSRLQTYRKLGEATFRDYRELTSGTVSTSELRKLRNPYAKSHGVADLAKPGGVAPVLPINRQYGRLQRSIRLVHRGSRYAVEDSVFFDPGVAGPSLWAISPEGTRSTIPRGLQEEAERRIPPRLAAFNAVFVALEDAAFSSPARSTRPYRVLTSL